MSPPLTGPGRTWALIVGSFVSEKAAYLPRFPDAGPVEGERLAWSQSWAGVT